MRLLITKLETKGSLVVLIGREEQTNRRVTCHIPFKPYFYIPVGEISTAAEKGLVVDDEIHKDILGADVVKVFCNTPGEVSRRRRSFDTTYEADIPYVRRFLIDRGIHSGIEFTEFEEIGTDVYYVQPEAIHPAKDVHAIPRSLLFDIETKKPHGSNKFSDKLEALGEVTANTFFDTYADRFVTYIWHPVHGEKGVVKLDHRVKYSKALKRDAEWEIRWCGSEEEMLLAWVQYLKDNQPDILNAWNGHQGFQRKNTGGYDVPYLITRLNRLGIGGAQMSPLGSARCGFEGRKGQKPRWFCSVDGVQLIDSMTLYQVKDGGFTGQVSYSDLKRVAAKKVDIHLKKDPANLERWWMYDTDDFLDYSFNDVDALLALELKERYIDWALKLQRFAGVEDANVVLRPSTLVGTLELREARKRGQVLPSASGEDYADEEVGGGHVIEPRKWGRMKNVAVNDLSKMYVAIIQSCNISYETLCRSGPGCMRHHSTVPTEKGIVRFHLDIRGITPTVCDDLSKLREEYDIQIKAATSPKEKERLKEERTPAKSLLLTTYGHMLNRHNRLYQPDCGRSVTGAGRKIITHLDEIGTQAGVSIIRGDTDSLFNETPNGEDPVEFGLWLQGHLNSSFDDLAKTTFNLETHNFSIAFEALWGRFVSGSQKKRYAGYVVWSEGSWMKSEELTIKGLEGIKSDAAKITEEATEALLKAILADVPDEEIIGYVTNLYNSVANGEVPLEDVIKAVQLNYDVDRDEDSVYTLEAAKFGQARFGFQYQVGMRVSVVRLQGDQWVAIPEGEDLPEDLRPDWEYHAGLAVLSPLESILEWIDLQTQAKSIPFGSMPTDAGKLW